MSERIQSFPLYLPFKAIFPVDPRNLVSVGDQVLCEHLFAFHANESIKKGFASSFSEIEINRRLNLVTIRPKFIPKEGVEQELSITDLAKGIASAVKGTSHFPYRELVKSITTEDHGVRLQFSKIPANLKYLFTLPDLAIFDPSNLPVHSESPYRSTGPYALKAVTEDSVHLELNPNYPQELRANYVKNVEIRHYSMVESESFIKEMTPETHPLAYFIGTSFLKNFADTLRKKNYRVNYFPSEWVAYFGVSETMPPEVRKLLRSTVAKARPSLGKYYDGVLPALSTVPADRPYSLSEGDVEYSTAEALPATSAFPLRIAVYERIASLQVTTEVITQAKRSFPNMQVEIIPAAEFRRLKTTGHAFIDFIGMSPADPLSHLSFLMHDDPMFKTKLSASELTQIAQLDDQHEFIQRVKAIERRIYDEILMIPIAHFPGVVVEAANFERVEGLAGSWGIQAWAYRVH